MINEIKTELEKMNNLQETENGGLGYKSTKNPLVDLNFRAAGMRNNITPEDICLFKDALEYDFEHTVKWLFMMRDVREGMGERDTFRRLFSEFSYLYPAHAIALVKVIAEYGRWDDVVEIAYDGSETIKETCYKIIEKRLMSDASVVALKQDGGISLLAKWLPSINASKTARRRALEVISYLHMSKKEYRQLLSVLRAKLDVTERKTCKNEWGNIDYNKVSSNANLRYKDAFLRYDRARREEYLRELANPNSNAKMNAKVLNPCEIWHKYMSISGDLWYYSSSAQIKDEDAALEAMWNNLKEVGETGNTLVVVDGSGSMASTIGNSSISALDVSRSLGVYFAERATGEFKNKFIEFSNRPKLLDLSGKESLKDKINYMLKFRDCTNTNIAAVFRLVLNAAVNNHMTQDDMPDRILIISDMEFDCIYDGNGTIFEVLTKEYENAGFKMPRLVFWNVASRTNTIPVIENDCGVALISGFSQNLLKMVMSNEVDPYKVLIETLDSERYTQIGDILQSVK